MKLFDREVIRVDPWHPWTEEPTHETVVVEANSAEDAQSLATKLSLSGWSIWLVGNVHPFAVVAYREASNEHRETQQSQNVVENALATGETRRIHGVGGKDV